MLIAIITAVIAINMLVLAHEFGHFIVARRSGIKVEIFSIGFGPRIFSFNLKGTEYRISLFLFGGYVKFLGDEIDDYAKKVPGGFYSASPFSRILVCVAGGFFNVILACILYTVIFFNGKPVTEDFLNTVVGGVKKYSVAEKTGILPGDKIIKVNSKPVKTWEELVYSIAFSSGNEIVLEIERGGEVITKIAQMTPDKETGVKMLGIYGRETIVVGSVLKDSPAEKSGLKADDRIIGINGEKVYRLEPLIQTIRNNEGKEVILDIIRDGKEMQIKTVPQKLHGEDYAAIGFVPTAAWTVIYPKPWDQLRDDIVRTWWTLKGLVTRKIPLKAVSGPVGIVGIIGLSMQVGWIPLLAIIALISLNLGIVNLLPIPVLDGGHIMFNIIEMIRKKPLSIRTIEKIQNVFTGLLIFLALYITYNDILKWFK